MSSESNIDQSVYCIQNESSSVLQKLACCNHYKHSALVCTEKMAIRFWLPMYHKSSFFADPKHCSWRLEQSKVAFHLTYRRLAQTMLVSGWQTGSKLVYTFVLLLELKNERLQNQFIASACCAHSITFVCSRRVLSLLDFVMRCFRLGTVFFVSFI